MLECVLFDGFWFSAPLGPPTHCLWSKEVNTLLEVLGDVLVGGGGPLLGCHLEDHPPHSV